MELLLVIFAFLMIPVAFYMKRNQPPKVSVHWFWWLFWLVVFWPALIIVYVIHSKRANAALVAAINNK